MDVYKARFNNLLSLLNTYQDARGGSERGLLIDFGKLIDVSDRQLSHLKSGRRNIGSATARKIEQQLGLKSGWMDVAHDQLQAETEQEKKFIDVVLRLYRSSPLHAQELILQAISERLCQVEQSQENAHLPSTSRKR